MLRIFTTILNAEKIKYATYKADDDSDEIFIQVESTVDSPVPKSYLDYLFRMLKITYGGKTDGTEV